MHETHVHVHTCTVHAVGVVVHFSLFFHSLHSRRNTLLCGSSFFLLCFLLSLIVVHYACDCSCTVHTALYVHVLYIYIHVCTCTCMCM